MTAPGGPSPGEAIRFDPLRPSVALRRRANGAWAFAGISAVVAAALFAVLDGRRQTGTAPDLTRQHVDGSAFVDPPPLSVPSPPVAYAGPPVIIPPAPAPDVAPPSPPVVADVPDPPRAVTEPLPPPPPLPRSSVQSPGRLNDPAVVFDQSADNAAAVTAGGAAGAAGTAAASATGGDDTAVRATVIRGRSTTVVQGSLIEATLETPIDSTRAGLVRAIVARDARGFDGSRILIARGSRLIGEYGSDVQSGQKRVLVTWTRLIRPDGVAIRLGSPSADRLGQAGIPGRADNHFLARFANAVLQTALTIGTNIASRPREGSVIVGVPGQAGGTVGQLLTPGTDLRTTIKVPQGAAVAIFVAHDLDFSGVTPRS